MTTHDDSHVLTSAVPAFTLAWKALLLDHRVTDGAARMYLVLATYARPDRPVAWPGQDVLARQMNVSTDTVQRHGKNLVDTGWIVKHRRGRGRSNLYHLMMPGALAVAVDKPVDATADAPLDAADVRYQEAADMRLPYEVEPGEVVTPPTPRKAGGARRASRRNTEPLSPSERADDFAAWWQAYPRKTGKIDAERAWRDMLPRIPDVDQLVAATEEFARFVARSHPETQEWTRWCPHPATWLRRGDFLVLDVGATRPPDRNPCALCGITNPSVERCMGVATGRISEPQECVWA